MLLLLSGCGEDKPVVSASQPLPTPPSDVVVCLENSKVSLPKGPWTSEQVVSIVAQLQDKADEQNGCGQRLIKFYHDVSVGRRKARGK